MFSEVFEPLREELAAAKKHNIAAIAKATVRADMKGFAIALGKKVGSFRTPKVVDERLEDNDPKDCSNVVMGLYPRKAAKSAAEAGTWLKAAAT